MKKGVRVVLIVVGICLLVFVVSDPPSATDRGLSVANNTWKIAAHVGDTVASWIDKNSGEIAKNKK